MGGGVNNNSYSYSVKMALFLDESGALSGLQVAKLISTSNDYDTLEPVSPLLEHDDDNSIVRRRSPPARMPRRCDPNKPNVLEGGFDMKDVNVRVCNTSLVGNGLKTHVVYMVRFCVRNALKAVFSLSLFVLPCSSLHTLHTH